MPRIGFICEVEHDYVSDAYCLDCALHRYVRTDPATGKERHCQYPYPYIAAAAWKDPGRKRAGISSTTIGNECARRAAWEALKNYFQYPHELQASISGTARHAYLEKFNESGVLAEVRLAYRLPSGRVITGQIDRYLAEHQRIEDYKFKSEEHGVFDRAPLGYTAQQNIYKLMLEDGCVIHETGEVLPPQVVKTMVLYPSNHKDWKEVKVPKWPRERVIWLAETMCDIIDASRRDPNYLPPRLYENPAQTKFCRNYCPHWQECDKAGGEKRDVLTEAMSIE